ncbi:uncharacterized protein LOC124113888 isoform X2 [Haliotis rufescens]|uniref:uncharacterized protein LOC124113888 isoform X2 n=1 Tax=Haliotis rufescens TaxID=6454 RepID=UPI00201F17D1|nr:uncharacterized protein LOC124113888 isoform X2 [Haliotis rufescens]
MEAAMVLDLVMALVMAMAMVVDLVMALVMAMAMVVDLVMALVMAMAMVVDLVTPALALVLVLTTSTLRYTTSPMATISTPSPDMFHMCTQAMECMVDLDMDMAVMAMDMGAAASQYTIMVATLVDTDIELSDTPHMATSNDVRTQTRGHDEKVYEAAMSSFHSLYDNGNKSMVVYKKSCCFISYCIHTVEFACHINTMFESS